MGRRANLVQAARDCVNALPVCKRKEIFNLYDSDFGLCMIMTTRRKLIHILHSLLDCIEYLKPIPKDMLYRYYKLNHIHRHCLSKCKCKCNENTSLNLQVHHLTSLSCMITTLTKTQKKMSVVM